MNYRSLDPQMGVAVAARTVLRNTPKQRETWGDVATRVAVGNLLMHPEVQGEYLKFRDHIAHGRILMSGRHLQHGDAQQPTRNIEVHTNCSTAATSFMLFYLLLNGSGVGRSYDDELMLVKWESMPRVVSVLDTTHADYLAGDFPSPERAHELYPNAIWFSVPDSREGWAKALEFVEVLTFRGKFRNATVILDFSKVRPKGQPIMGMQGRPSSGPLPVMQAFAAAHDVARTPSLPEWKRTMIIDHQFADAVVVGGARRSARMAVKSYKDADILEFINIKRDGGLWTANNSVGVDADFWVQAVINGTREYDILQAILYAQYHHATGEPGIINLDKLHSNMQDFEIHLGGETIGNDKFPLEDPDSKKLYGQLAEQVSKMQYPYIVNPCGEIPLNALGGYCVAGNTRILHRRGYDRIVDLVGKDIEVFNGQEWSTVTPFKTGENQRLVRVTLSDGSYLDCTPKHRFSIRGTRQGNTWYEKQAKELKPGHILPTFRIPQDIEGDMESEAYTYGAFLGDGGIELRKDSGKLRYTISLYKNKHHLPISGTRAKEQHNTGITVTVSHLDEIKLQSLKQDTLPEWVFKLDRPSLLEFLKGWLDTDGTFHKDSEGVSFTTSKEGRAKDLQLLLRRLGLSYVSLRQVANIGDINNFGLRKSGLWQVYVPAAEASILNGHRVKTTYPIDLTKQIKQPRVISVEPLAGTHPTFCFTEPKRGMGVFGNMLTFQCVIADVVPFYATKLSEALDAFKVAARALVRVNKMNSLYHGEVERTNRIGVGFTGIHEFMWKHFGLTFHEALDEFGTGKKFWTFMNQARELVEQSATEYAIALGMNVPHTFTTVKPAGTTSKLFSLTEGAHLPTMRWYLRWVQFQQDDPLIEEYREKGYPVIDEIPAGSQVSGYTNVKLVGFPTEPLICTLGMPEELLVTAADATMDEQYRWVQLIEKYWLGPKGNQVSYTLKYNREAVPFNQYARVLTAMQPTVRCTSVMPADDWRMTKAKFGYVPEEPITREYYDWLLQHVEAREQVINLSDLQCASGACPI